MTKRIFSLAIVVVMLFTIISSMCLSVSAATSKTTYDCKITRVITVKTGKSRSTPYIKFACEGDRWCKGYSKSDAPIMSLKVYDHSTKATSWKRISGNGTYISSTLTLEKNRMYTITVSYIYNRSLNFDYFDIAVGKTWNIGHWYVSSTRNVSSYSIK